MRKLAALVYLGFLANYVVRYTYDRLNRLKPRLQSLLRLVRVATRAVWSPLPITIGTIRFTLLLMLTILSAEALLGLLVLVVLTTTVNYLGLPLVLALKSLGDASKTLGWTAGGRWINRLGWATLVLPLQTLSQTTKAWANLISVAFGPHSAATRWIAILAVPCVYLGALLLMVVCDIVLLPVVMAFGTPSEPLSVGLGLCVFAFYLGFIKVSLGALDLILDIANFHLASADQRSVYFERLEQGMETLKRCGCREIHVLAHSLGSVISYSWLATEPSRACRITVLHPIGAPLDKFWYTDRSKDQRVGDERELVTHPKLRWYNYWAASDPVSGHLDHFGQGSRQVENIRIRRLGCFLYSHVRYWVHRRVIDGLLAAIGSSSGSPAAGSRRAPAPVCPASVEQSQSSLDSLTDQVLMH